MSTSTPQSAVQHVWRPGRRLRHLSQGRALRRALFKADFLNHEQKVTGFPDSLDATSFGVRTDAGYRFGGFRGKAGMRVSW